MSHCLDKLSSCHTLNLLIPLSQIFQTMNYVRLNNTRLQNIGIKKKLEFMTQTQFLFLFLPSFKNMRNRQGSSLTLDPLILKVLQVQKFTALTIKC